MEPFIFTLLLGLAVGHFIFILNRTDFVTEYAKAFHLEKEFFVAEYEAWKEKENLEHGYPIFIRETFNTFWGRLIGCPFCLATFSSLALSIFSGSWLFLLVGLAAAGIASTYYLAVNLLYSKNFS